MKIFLSAVLLLSCVAAVSAVESPDLWQRIKQDHVNYYSLQNAAYFGASFGLGAVLANGDTDEDIQQWYLDDIHSDGTDDAAKIVKNFGEGILLAGVVGATAFLGDGDNDDSALGNMGVWGRRTMRAIIVGTPSMLIMQRATGAGRPVEGGSAWNFWDDSNGVSGHSFVGALSFLTAAEMTDSKPLKYTLYVASTFAGWSRLNDDKHYASQVFLGWFMAWRSVQAVSQSDSPDERAAHFDLLPLHGGAALAFDYRF